MIPNASPFQPGDRVVGYCRYSEGEEQGQKDTSAEEQAAAIKQFCETHRLQLVRIYADPFASGRSVKGRDHYLEMLSDLLRKKKPDIAGVILWDWERYGRNFNQAAMDAARLRMAGYKLFSMQQPIYDEGPFAHVLEAMYFASAQNQSDMISADVKRALQNNFTKYRVIPRSCIPRGFIAVPVECGTYRDGSPRIGYRAAPDPAVRDKIRDAFLMYLEGEDVERIRDYVGIWSSTTAVHRAMKNPIFCGRFTYGGTTMEDYCEPIVSPEIFARVQVHEASHPHYKRQREGGWSQNRALLSGLVFCAECGAGVYIDRRTAKGRSYETYRCNQKHGGIPAAELDELVINAAHDLLTPEKVAESRAELIRRYGTPRQDTKAIRAKLSKIDTQIGNLTAAIADGLMSKAVTSKLAQLEKEKEDLERGLAEEERPTDFFDDRVEEARQLILTVLDDPESTTDDKRAALSMFIKHITIDREGCVKITYTLPGLSSGLSQSCGSNLVNLPAPPEGVEPPTS